MNSKIDGRGRQSIASSPVGLGCLSRNFMRRAQMPGADVMTRPNSFPRRVCKYSRVECVDEYGHIYSSS